MPRAEKVRVGVVGVGQFGSRRAAVGAASPGSEVRVVADLVSTRARNVAEKIGCDWTTRWEQAVSRHDVDSVIVSTTTEFLHAVTRAALEAGKHVLCEKPFGRVPEEVLPAVELARKKCLCLKVGYNHRYHPALAKAHDLFREDAIGRIQFIRCRYGHGGRPGYEQEWRTRAEESGGGQLLDQGVHALDLFRWFLGDFSEVTGYLETLFWPIAPVEDNVFALLRTQDGRVASLHASWTNWKNIFSFEVFGDRGYLVVSGLGGHYGPECLRWGVRHEIGVKPEEHDFEFPGQDSSLEREWEDFVKCILEGKEPQSSGEDGWRTLKLAEAIYRSAREARTVRVDREEHQPLQIRYSGEKAG